MKRTTWIGPIILLGVLIACIGYWFYWNHLAERLKAGAEAWVSARQAQGVQAGYADLSVGGFPYRLALHVAAPELAAPDEALAPAWSAEQLTVYFQPWDLHHAIVTTEGQQRLGWTDAGSTRRQALVQAESSRASVRFDKRGNLETMAADLQTVRVQGDGPLATADRLQFHLRYLPAETADAHPETAIAVGGDGLVPVPESPVPFTLIDRVLVSVLFRPLPAGLSAADLDRWRDDAGVAEIQRLEFAAGPMTVNGNGTFAFDPLRRPEAAGTVQVQGGGALLDRFAGQNRLSDGERLGLRIGLAAIEKPDENGVRTATLPMTLQDGRLRVMNIGVANLGPAY